ncbi:MAG: glycosyltransferase, partial [Pirellulales bacterium]
MTARVCPWHVVFAGGGTGGHLFPGLAVAEQLRDLLDVRITFAGCGKPLEREAVIAAGHDYLPLPCRPTPPRARDLPRFVLDNLQGYRQAVRFLR